MNQSSQNALFRFHTLLQAHQVLQRVVLCVVSVVLATSANAIKPDSKLDSALQHFAGAKMSRKSVNVILKTSGPITKSQQRQVARLGAHSYRALPFINSVAASVQTRRLLALAAL